PCARPALTSPLASTAATQPMAATLTLFESSRIIGMLPAVRRPVPRRGYGGNVAQRLPGRSMPTQHQRSRRWLLRALVAAAVLGVGAAVAVGGVLLAGKSPAVALRLPDGTPFQLLTVTYGRRHRYVRGTRFQQALCGRVPPALWERIGGE